MSNSQNLRLRYRSLMNAISARRVGYARPATGFVLQQEPRSIGHLTKGRQLLAGNLMFAGHLIEAKDQTPWDFTPPTAAFAAEIHGFAWLDDLAAAGGSSARKTAQKWVVDWIDRYGKGQGPGWTPDLAGRRIIRLIHHAPMLLSGLDRDGSRAFFRSLGQQTLFLSKRWQATLPGLARFEALTGLIYAGLSLSGMEANVAPATRVLGKECCEQIDEQGGIPTRNPEELLEVFTLLTWAAAALTDAGWTPAKSHTDALTRIAPTLRALRHADGSLARFHGGGRGVEGRLDHALAASGNKAVQSEGLSMGFARQSFGRTSVVVDASPPPKGIASVNAHASSLAFELTSGRRAVIVNCGSGISFGEEWRRAGRATPSHSTLCLDNVSSAHLGKPSRHVPSASEMLINAPVKMPAELSYLKDGMRFEGAHDGYLREYGLTHVRRLDLSQDGRALVGEDMLFAIEDDQQARFDRLVDYRKLEGVPYAIRFHIHPEVEATIDMGGSAVSLALKSGEIWVFRHDGTAHLTLDSSVYLETGRLQPRATKQIILSSRAISYSERVRWSLSKAHDTAVAVRDLSQDDLDPTT